MPDDYFNAPGDDPLGGASMAPSAANQRGFDPADAVPPTPAPDPAQPWGPGDDISLSRLSAALGHVGQQIADGLLQPDTGQQLLGQIKQRIKPLQDKQQQDQQKKQKEVQDQQHQAAAQQQAIESQNAIFHAKLFPQTVVNYQKTDPVTGKTRQKDIMFDGKTWKPIDYGESEAALDRQHEMAMQSGEAAPSFTAASGDEPIAAPAETSATCSTRPTRRLRP